VKAGRTKRLAGAGLSLGLLGSILVASPAFAASSSCSTWLDACVTGIVYANAAHDLRVITSGPCGGEKWSVYDQDTGVTVAHGTGGTNRVIHGLYGRYVGGVEGAICGKGYITIQDF
jgi:hypothetical protein